VIFATGSMVKAGIDLIENDFSDFGLYSVSQIKPFNESDFLKIAKDASFLITLEEHSIYGGLGGTIAEVSTTHLPTRILRLGIEDKFSDKCGSWEYLMLEHGLNKAALAKKISAYTNGL
jgi:transketolase